MSIKGLPFIGKVKEFLNRELYVTVQKVGASRAALDVIHKGYYILNPVPTVPYVAELGSTDEVIKLTAHGFKPGDLIRLDSTANQINEFEIIIDSVIDANTFKLSGYLSASLTAGDTFFALRPVSERFAADGSTLASMSTPPVSYNRRIGGVTTQTMALEDLDNPANSRGIPVVLHGLDAANITVTANQLNIASEHTNDSVRLGDGTTLTQVTALGELKTSDATAQGSLANLDTNIGAKSDAVATTDTGTFSLIALIKKVAQNITNMALQLPASLGAKTSANSLSVTMASDQSAIPTSQVFGIVESGNSSTTPLGIGGVFTGASFDMLNYGMMIIAVATDRNGTIGIQFSQDNVNWDHSQNYSVTVDVPGTPQGFQFMAVKEARYFRVVYTNGGTAQGVFRLQTIASTHPMQAEINQVNQPLLGNTDALVTKGVIYGLTTGGGGGYVSVKVTPSGALVADITGTVAVSSSALPSGASTLAEQQTQTTALSTLNTNIGAKADAVAADDTGTFSLIALIKKIASNITTMSAKLPAALGVATSANSLSITPASDAIFNTKPKALTNSFDENAAITTVVTFTAPANAIGGKIMATDTNITNARYKQNGTATTTSGMQLQPGRAEDFTGGSNITVVAESGTVGVSIQWTIQA